MLEKKFPKLHVIRVESPVFFFVSCCILLKMKICHIFTIRYLLISSIIFTETSNSAHEIWTGCLLNDIWINELSHRLSAVTAIFRLRTDYVNWLNSRKYLAMLQNLQSEGIVGDDVITHFSTLFEL